MDTTNKTLNSTETDFTKQQIKDLSMIYPIFQDVAF